MPSETFISVNEVDMPESQKRLLRAIVQKIDDIASVDADQISPVTSTEPEALVAKMNEIIQAVNLLIDNRS